MEQLNAKIMKKYNVSLAVSIPANFEGEIEADSPEEAQDRAIDIFESGDWDENGFMVSDDYCGETELNLGKKYRGKIYEGANIEEN